MIRQFNKSSFWFYPFLLIVIVEIIGCTIGPKGHGTRPEKDKGFSHKVHTESGAACKSCHMKVSKDVNAGMPDERLCGFCHQTVYDGQPVGELYNREKWQLSHKTERIKYEEIKMSHQQHMSVGVKCSDCHGNIDKSTKVTLEHIPVKKTCFTCHSEWNSANQCDTCHKEIRYDVPPHSHDGNFMKTHGQMYREESIRPGESLENLPSCSICHSDDYCVNCHQSEAPENHNNQWRLRGHGITVGINRNECNTCHKTDFCVRCHESTRPRSHITSNWGNPNNQHCRSCHLPVSLTNCSVCHNGTPSHFEGPPGSHGAGWGNPINKHCINCHVEDSTCSVCHRGTPSHREIAPSSHSGQWGSPKHNHCLRCHVPISTSLRCNECHGRVSEHLSEAPSIPADFPHSRGLTCRSCHSSSGPILTHADNGLDCRLCHK